MFWLAWPTLEHIHALGCINELLDLSFELQSLLALFPPALFPTATHYNVLDTHTLGLSYRDISDLDI